MKTALLVIARLMFVAIYSIAIGVCTGWIWTWFMDRQVKKLAQHHHARQQPIAA